MGSDISAFAEFDESFAQRVGLFYDLLPFVKAQMFAPPIFGKVLPRRQFCIRQAADETGTGRDHNDIFQQMGARFAPGRKFIKPADFEMFVKMRIQQNMV